ncbi:hypothetical protein LZK73_21710 [Neorhizobium galegae]|nr:hypothetical protein LZK73_21710 [Neorhizobium galegae]
MTFSRIITTLQSICGLSRKVAPRNATAPWRPYAATGTNISQDEKWRSMKLRKRRMVVDRDGKWWLIEERQCLYTGAIFKRTRRITE